MARGDCQRPTFERRASRKNFFEGRSHSYLIFRDYQLPIEASDTGRLSETHFLRQASRRKIYEGTITYLFDFSWLSTSMRQWHGATIERPTFEASVTEKNFLRRRSHSYNIFFVIINFNRGEFHGPTVETHFFWEASVTEKIFLGTITYLLIFRDYQLNRGGSALGRLGDPLLRARRHGNLGLDDHILITFFRDYQL